MKRENVAKSYMVKKKLAKTKKKQHLLTTFG